MQNKFRKIPYGSKTYQLGLLATVHCPDSVSHKSITYELCQTLLSTLISTTMSHYTQKKVSHRKAKTMFLFQDTTYSCAYTQRKKNNSDHRTVKHMTYTPPSGNPIIISQLDLNPLGHIFLLYIGPKKLKGLEIETIVVTGSVLMYCVLWTERLLSRYWGRDVRGEKSNLRTKNLKQTS